MSTGITLILDRQMGDLWLQQDGLNFEVIWDVTGVTRKTEDFNSVRILRKGKQIGLLWNVEEIKERWE